LIEVSNGRDHGIAIALTRRTIAVERSCDLNQTSRAE